MAPDHTRLDGEKGKGRPRELVPNSWLSHMDGKQCIVQDQTIEQEFGVGRMGLVLYFRSLRYIRAIQWAVGPGLFQF